MEEERAEKPRQQPGQADLVWRFYLTIEPTVLEFAEECSLEDRAALAARLENLAEVVRES